MSKIVMTPAIIKKSLAGKVLAKEYRALLTPDMYVTGRWNSPTIHVQSERNEHEFFEISLAGSRTVNVYRRDVQAEYAQASTPELVAYLHISQEQAYTMTKTQLIHLWVTGLVANQDDFLTNRCKRKLVKRFSRYSKQERSSYDVAQERDTRVDTAEQALLTLLTPEQYASYQNVTPVKLWETDSTLERFIAHKSLLDSERVYLLAIRHDSAIGYPEVCIFIRGMIYASVEFYGTGYFVNAWNDVLVHDALSQVLTDLRDNEVSFLARTSLRYATRPEYTAFIENL